MAMENGPVEDVFPIENGDIPLLVYQRVTSFCGGSSFGGLNFFWVAPLIRSTR